MIRVPTVLILGAGASKPYGYYTGTELIEKVCVDLANSHSTDQGRQLQELGFSLGYIKEFAQHLRDADPDSIDEFLEKNLKYIELGRTVITRTLVDQEVGGSVYNRQWYSYLFNRGLKTQRFEDLGENKLTIITFNYDRSLDHYLFNTIKNSFGKPEEDVSEKMKFFPILHLYGQIGYLPWQNIRNNRPYGSNVDTKELKRNSKGINIIHEVNPKSKVFTRTKAKMRKARRIYFMGFGFHQTNIDRLGIKELDFTNKDVRGICYGMNGTEIHRVREKMYNKIDVGKFPNQEIIDFLRNAELS